MNTGLWIEIGTLLVATVGVVGGLLALRQANRQRRLDLGGLYLQRYWEIDDDLLRLPKGSPEHTRARHRYLRLCEDEFEAARRGWLEPDQWNVWHAWLAEDAARAQVDVDLIACKAPVDRFLLLRECSSVSAQHSWKECPARVRVG
ncbi:hypothetical protein [Tessaracoccus defluvii]|uniref:hypothetical protein n=1 Tax=Tessaracoccus defluvii TaxID=1285901 RepID=UPI0031D6F1C4